MEDDGHAVTAAAQAREGRAQPSAWVVLAVLAAIVAAVYAQTASFDYVFDDMGFLLARAEVREGLSPAAVRWALQSWDYGNWFPLTRLSWLADVELFGMDPGPAHLVNALLHLANAWCMFLFLAAATGLRRSSAALAALWAAHPLQVETVAWVSERSLLLGTLFLWATLGAYLAYVRRPGAGRYLLVLLGAVLGLLAKPILLALPLVLLLLDWWPLGRTRSGPAAAAGLGLLILEKLPFAVLVAGFAARTVVTQDAAGSFASLQSLPFAHRLGGAIRSVSWYLVKAALPSDLGAYYPLSIASLPWWRTAAVAALLAGISAVAVRVWRTRPRALVGWLWFGLTLVPVAGIVQAGAQSTADRYCYIPLFGLLLLASGLLAPREAGSRPARFAGVAVALAVTALSAASFAQTRHWRNELSLFGRALSVSEVESPLIRNHLAEASERAGDFAAALRHHRVALRLRPDWALTHRGLGRLLARQGDFEAAERHLREAVRLDPAETRAHADLEDLLRCREEPATAAACLAQTMLARADDRRP